MALDDFNPDLTYTSFEKFMDNGKTALQREHLETVVRHSRGEVHADLDAVMETLAAAPQYHEDGVYANTSEDMGPKALAAVQANYAEMVNTGSYVIESKKTRVVVSD